MFKKVNIEGTKRNQDVINKLWMVAYACETALRNEGLTVWYSDAALSSHVHKVLNGVETMEYASKSIQHEFAFLATQRRKELRAARITASNSIAAEAANARTASKVKSYGNTFGPRYFR